MPNKNAAVIIPLAIGAWLVSGLAFGGAAPRWAGVAFMVAFAIAVPLVVFYLMADMGWRRLARRYRARVPWTGRWRTLPTAEVSTVSVQHPEYARHRLRLVSTVRVGLTDTSLYLSMLFGRIPLLGWLFFPDVQIDWSDVRAARPYEAPGGFRRGHPGNISANYDPNTPGRSSSSSSAIRRSTSSCPLPSCVRFGRGSPL